MVEMKIKPYIYAGIVFALAYFVSTDYFFAGVNGFAVFYILVMRERKSEQALANAEAGM